MLPSCRFSIRVFVNTEEFNVAGLSFKQLNCFAVFFREHQETRRKMIVQEDMVNGLALLLHDKDAV